MRLREPLWSKLSVSLLGLLCALGCGVQSEQSYQVNGVVEAVDAELAQIKIAHEEIPDFMPAMTMNFDVADPALLVGVTPGARVHFTLLRRGSELRITALEVTGAEAAGTSGGFPAPPGEGPAPEVELIDQDGAAFSLEALRGRAVLLDFVFTRCPGPCPILTAAHARLQRALPREIGSRTHFVSISIDPEYDTPALLGEYARARGADLANWSFLTGSPERVQEVLAAYHVGTLRQPDGSIDHLLITYLIDPQGRIARRYLGLEHGDAEITSDLREILS